jgi:hypothetical protein
MPVIMPAMIDGHNRRLRFSDLVGELALGCERVAFGDRGPIGPLCELSQFLLRQAGEDTDPFELFGIHGLSPPDGFGLR